MYFLPCKLDFSFCSVHLHVAVKLYKCDYCVNKYCPCCTAALLCFLRPGLQTEKLMNEAAAAASGSGSSSGAVSVDEAEVEALVGRNFAFVM